MSEDKTAEQLTDEIVAQDVYDAATRLQTLINRAYSRGLDVQLHVERIEDCAGLRQRPDLLIFVSKLIRRKTERVATVVQDTGREPAVLDKS